MRATAATLPSFLLVSLAALGGCGTANTAGSVGDARTPGAAEIPMFVPVRPGGAGGGDGGLYLSSQPPADAEASAWLGPVRDAARQALNDGGDTGAAVARACAEEKSRPAALAMGSTIKVVTAAGVVEGKIGACRGDELGGEVLLDVALEGAPVSEWALASVGSAPLPADARLAPPTPAGTSERLAALRADLAAQLPSALAATLPNPLTEAVVQLVAAPAGAHGTGVAAVCISSDAAFCDLSLVAMVDDAGHVKSYLWQGDGFGLDGLPSLGGMKAVNAFGGPEALGTLALGGRVAVLLRSTSPGDEFIDLLWLGPDGPAVQRLFELVVE